MQAQSEEISQLVASREELRRSLHQEQSLRMEDISKHTAGFEQWRTIQAQKEDTLRQHEESLTMAQKQLLQEKVLTAHQQSETQRPTRMAVPPRACPRLRCDRPTLGVTQPPSLPFAGDIEELRIANEQLKAKFEERAVHIQQSTESNASLTSCLSSMKDQLTNLQQAYQATQDRVLELEREAAKMSGLRAQEQEQAHSARSQLTACGETIQALQHRLAAETEAKDLALAEGESQGSGLAIAVAGTLNLRSPAPQKTADSRNEESATRRRFRLRSCLQEPVARGWGLVASAVGSGGCNQRASGARSHLS